MPLNKEQMDMERKAARDAMNAEAEGKDSGPGMLQRLLGGTGAAQLLGAVAGAGVATLTEKNEKDAAAKIARGMEIGDDASRNSMDSFSGGLANQVRSKVGGTELEDELAASREAEMRLGPTGTAITEAGGKAAQAMIPGLGALSTVPKAIGVGAGLGGGNAITEALGKGETPDPAKVAASTGMGAIGAGLGKVVGDRLGGLVSRYLTETGSHQAMWKQAGKQVEKLTKEVGDASTAMTNAGVRVDTTYLRKATSVLESKLNRQRSYEAGNLPFAKSAMDMIKRNSEVGRAASLDDINELRQNIRDSITDGYGAWASGVSHKDARLVHQIDRMIGELMKKLPSNPKAVIAGDAKAGIAAFERMNAGVPRAAKANLIAGAFDRADLESKSKGLPFDSALQNEFKKIYKSKQGIAEFRGPEKDLIREGAEGAFGTQWLNKLDRAYGHGGLFSFVWNSVSKVPRAASGRAAETNARDIFEKLTQAELKRAGAAAGGSAGAAAGIAGGQMLTPDISAPGLQQSLGDLMK